MRKLILPLLVLLLLSACLLPRFIPNIRISWGDATSTPTATPTAIPTNTVAPPPACPPDPYEPHPDLVVDLRCPKVGEQFTITVTNSTVEHPYYTLSLNDSISLVTLTYDGQVRPGQETTAFEILSTQASEWEMAITLKALAEGEYTFGVSSTGIVGGMWLGDGYGRVLVVVGR